MKSIKFHTNITTILNDTLTTDNTSAALHVTRQQAALPFTESRLHLRTAPEKSHKQTMNTL